MQQILFIAGIASAIIGTYFLFKQTTKLGIIGLFTGFLLIASAYLTVYIWEKEELVEKNEKTIRIIGSKTIGQYLMPSLVKLYLESSGYTVFKQNELPEKYEISASKKNDDKKSIIHFEITITGSIKGFDYLKNGTVDVAMSSTLMPEDIAQSLGSDFNKKNNKHIIGYDAIRIIMHPSRSKTISSINYDLFEKIIQGEAPNWKDIDKNLNGELNICLRDSNSGTYKFIEEKFLSHFIPDSLHIPAKFQHFDYFEKIAKKVSEDSLSMGLVDFGIDSLIIKDVHTIGIVTKDGRALLPTISSISDFSYPLSRPLILYTKGDISKNIILTDFIKFCSSKTVSEAVEKMGFVSK